MVYAAPRTVWLFVDELDTSLDAGEIQVGEKLFVRKVSEEIMQALETAKVERGPELFGRSRILIECKGAVDGLEQKLPLEFVRALVIGTQAHIRPSTMITFEPKVKPIAVPPTVDPYSILWGIMNMRLEKMSSFMPQGCCPQL
jgi:hypothetical protein